MNPYLIVLLEPEDADAFWDAAKQSIPGIYVVSETVAFAPVERHQTVHEIARAVSLTVDDGRLGFVVEMNSYGGCVYQETLDWVKRVSNGDDDPNPTSMAAPA